MLSNNQPITSREIEIAKFLNIKKEEVIQACKLTDEQRIAHATAQGTKALWDLSVEFEKRGVYYQYGLVLKIILSLATEFTHAARVCRRLAGYTQGFADLSGLRNDAYYRMVELMREALETGSAEDIRRVHQWAEWAPNERGCLRADAVRALANRFSQQLAH